MNPTKETTKPANGEPTTAELERLEQLTQGAVVELTPEEAAANARATQEQIDNDDQLTPQLALAPLPVFWRIDNVSLAPGMTGVIITFVSPAFPNGIPILLDRERGRKFASQLRKRLEGPAPVDLSVARSRLILPPGAGGA